MDLSLDYDLLGKAYGDSLSQINDIYKADCD